MTLAEARDKALENRRAVYHGGDPRAVGIPTFRTAGEKVIALHAGAIQPRMGGGLPRTFSSGRRLKTHDDYGFFRSRPASGVPIAGLVRFV